MWEEPETPNVGVISIDIKLYVNQGPGVGIYWEGGEGQFFVVVAASPYPSSISSIAELFFAPYL